MCLATQECFGGGYEEAEELNNRGPAEIRASSVKQQMKPLLGSWR